MGYKKDLMTDLKELIDASDKVYERISKIADSHEEVIMILELAKNQASRSASLSDIQNGYHLEQDIESE